MRLLPTARGEHDEHCDVCLIVDNTNSSYLYQTKGRTFHELDILFAKKIPARQFASTNIDEFDESEQNRLANRYAAGDTDTLETHPRPSIIPGVTNFLASHGKDEAAAAQRRASLTIGEDGGSRRPSIAPAVTEYLHKRG